jgi:NAD(P)H-dependent FMN reductase
MPNLLVILASTRPGRTGLPVSDWFVERAVASRRFAVQLVDLAELDLPFLDEPVPAVMRQYTHAHTRAWSATVEAADAIVVITPEYNYGYPAPLKNALDFLNHEWRHKAIGFVSYGGVAAGTRAVQQLVQVTSALQMVPAATAVHIPFVFGALDEEGRLIPHEVTEGAADTMLAEMEELDGALAQLRNSRLERLEVTAAAEFADSSGEH